MATRKSAAPKKTSRVATTSADAAPAKRQRADWPAIERDYRTGRFTEQELSDKYGNVVSRQAIGKHMRDRGITKDLSTEVRQATKASVIRAQIEERVAQQVAEGCAEATIAATDAVIAAAELNKQVIVGHRKSLKSAQQVAGELLAELSEAALLLSERKLLALILAGESAEPVDIAQAQAAITKALGLGNRSKTFKAITDALVNLQGAERVAFGLDEKDGDKDKDPVAQSISDFLGGIHSAAAGRLTFAPGRKA